MKASHCERKGTERRQWQEIDGVGERREVEEDLNCRWQWWYSLNGQVLYNVIEEGGRGRYTTSHLYVSSHQL